MKKAKTIIICMLFSYCIPGLAQTSSVEYRPMAQEGKTWETQIGLIMENCYDSKVEGDTLINGEIWKKVYNFIGRPQELDKTYFAAMRDVGKKVYAIAKGSNRPRLLYDFGLKVGQMVRCGVESTNFGCLLDTDEQPDTLMGFPHIAYLRVERIDTVKAYEQEYRYFTLTLLDRIKQWMLMSDPVIWVEGIGSGVGPFSPWTPFPTKEYCMYTTCFIDKTNIFRFPWYPDNNQGTDVIRSSSLYTNNGNVIHNLQGRRLSGKPEKGVYIQDGRKRVTK